MLHSFGIHVARMAGMPPSLIDRANEILVQLEKSRNTEGDEQNVTLEQTVKNLASPKVQLSIFDVHSITFEAIRVLLDAVDINRLTPVEALLKLQEIKAKIK